MRGRMIAVIAVVGVLAAFLVLIWWGQERILFQPPRFDIALLDQQRVDYRAADGQKLVGYVVGSIPSSPGVLICFHGNADLAVWQLDWARLVARETGYAVFLAEYRGYMNLGGTPTYTNTRLDAEAAYDKARSLGADSSRLAYFGHSLGSGVAAELAASHPPRALVLQSPFTSARAMARLVISQPIVLAWNAVSRIHFDTRQLVSRLDVPVAVAHGTRDRVVPHRMGLEVYQAAKKKGPLLVVEGAGHNDVTDVAGPAYWEWIRKALDGSHLGEH